MVLQHLEGRGGLVVRYCPQSQRVPCSKPDSIEDTVVYCARCTGKSYVRAQTSYHWCSAEAWRGGSRSGSQLSAVQNYEFRPKIAFVLLQNGKLL
ncbi:hypothetical protein AVEN_188128-1 [Araneus ventricosus]|uniref:Uncharacterized protein n=1 Tax=Araneus ventricosus TaxID=182803 RepID=A0A4Y2WV02_ARAVE|nr:hypothetical protein AVEN_254571-1 [Araneus ventricosus]GBO39723.1 hypothetical protein AVEN_188128-1 [Araneus ventricosus]